MYRFHITLAQKVILAFLIVLLPILIVFFVSYSSTKAHVEKLIVDDLKTIAEDREGDVLMFLDMVSNRITDFATDDYIVTEMEELQRTGSDGFYLSDYIRAKKIPLIKNIYRISAVTMEGKIAASSITSVVGMDISGEEFFTNAKKGIMVTERDHGYLNMPEIVISAPLYNKEGTRQTGFLMGIVLVSRFKQVFTGEISKELGAISWDIREGRKSLDIYLVNRDRLMLTESRFTQGAVLKQVVDAEPVRKCLEEKKEYAGFYKDFRGMEVAGASMCFPGLQWTMLVEIDKNEILKPVAMIGRYTMLSVVITISFVGILVIFFLRVVIKQLQKLAAGAMEISAGNYNVNIPVRSSDEIGLLSESFNNMALEIKNRTNALKESTERLNALLDNTANIVYLKDTEGRYILINRRYEELFNIREQDIAGKSDFDIFPRDIAEKFRENDLKALYADKPVQFEETVPQSDGMHVYLSIKYHLKDPEGKKYAVGGISTDITDIRRIDEALMRSEAGLANAQRIAHIGSWEWDMITNDLYWSDEVYRIFGAKPQEFGASYDAFLNYIHPDDRAFVQDSVNRSIYERKPYSIDHRVVLSDGTERIVHEQGEVKYDDSGKPVRMTGTVQDITERKRAEEEVRRLNEELERRVVERTGQLEAANRELEAFSYSVAHDLRSPLRIIDGFSQVLLEDFRDRLDQHGQDHLKRLRAASIRMSKLIDDLLELSRVTRAEMKHEAINMTSIARAIASELKKTQPDRKVEFVIQEDLRATGDVGLLRVVLDNLIGNAWKFTGKMPEARIEFGSLGTEDGKSIFYVKDNGAGFNMQYADKLFGAFQRLHSADDFPGTGIGLATVQRIIQRHGGRVWAEGEPGKGATFYFTL
ncbi:MAG: PAS domain S-box protein [Deltaproteobacteria bacterium]|nr:PAS domain S-box protein [Deltaproteobacteria bacterium]